MLETLMKVQNAIKLYKISLFLDIFIAEVLIVTSLKYSSFSKTSILFQL